MRLNRLLCKCHQLGAVSSFLRKSTRQCNCNKSILLITQPFERTVNFIACFLVFFTGFAAVKTRAMFLQKRSEAFLPMRRNWRQ